MVLWTTKTVCTAYFFISSALIHKNMCLQLSRQSEVLTYCPSVSTC